ncbi:MAG: PcsB-like coiled-coil domain-containing protein [Tractidigestivibacter sp.]|jgi:peptidoglycan hydrolase CwlO-like protein|uniref:PcsB-like coiled-coil domain-containing protein n=1 Tax=Tractidigestivibacter sp. TaxID=2847320 RepID=UPI003D8C0E39
MQNSSRNQGEEEYEAAGSGRSITRRDAFRFIAGGAGAGLFALATPLTAFATSQSDIDSAQAEADAAQSELDSITSEVESISSQLSDTTDQIDSVSSQISSLQADIDQKQADIEDMQDQIDEKQQEIEADQEVLAKRMSSAFKAGNAGVIDILLSSTTFEEFTSNVAFLDRLTESDNEMIQTVKGLQEELKAQQEELENEKQELETQKSDLESQQTELENLKADQQSQLADVQSKQAEAEQLVEQLNSEVQDLISQRNAELLAAQEAARQVRETTSSGGTTSSPSIESGASGSQAAVVSAAYSTPSVGAGYCAAWVSNVFRNAGIGSFSGNACDMYWAYCTSSDQSAIQTGMIVAVPTEPYSAAAILYGHIGIYVGNGTVRHSASGVVKSQSLSSWISEFGVTSTPRWGWLGGVVLA